MDTYKFDFSVCSGASRITARERRTCSTERGTPPLLCPLRVARWNLAVAAEVAGPHEMNLATVASPDGHVVDFTWLSISPAAARSLGCVDVEMVGASLRAYCRLSSLGEELFALCARALITGRAHAAGIGEADGACLYQVVSTKFGAKVVVTNLAAAERFIAAQHVLRTVKAAISGEDDAWKHRCLGDRASLTS